MSQNLLGSHVLQVLKLIRNPMKFFYGCRMFEELVNGLDEATQMLTHELVRGDLNEQTGRYGTYDVFVFILSNNIFAIHIVV